MSEGLASGDCGVCIGGYDGDGCDTGFYNEKIVTARKPHQCYECQCTIQRGEKYERVTGKWDDEISTYTFCAICSEIGRAFCCEGRTFGCLWDEVHEQLFPNLTTGCLAKLSTAAAKEALLKKWRKLKGLAA